MFHTSALQAVTSFLTLHIRVTQPFFKQKYRVLIYTRSLTSSFNSVFVLKRSLPFVSLFPCYRLEGFMVRVTAFFLSSATAASSPPVSHDDGVCTVRF